MRRRKSLSELLPHSLGKRLFFIICIVGVILVISLGIMVSAVAGTSLYNSEKEKLVSESKQIINVFDQYIEILENTAMAASRQRCIQKLMSDPANDFEEYVNYRDAYSYIRNVHEYYTGIHLYIFFPMKGYLMTSNEKDIMEDYRKEGVDREAWYQELENASGGLLLQPDFAMPASEETSFSFAYTVRDGYTWETRAYVIATLDKSVMEELFTTVGTGEDSILLIVTQDGRIAYNSAPEVFDEGTCIPGLYTQFKNGDRFVNESGEQYIYSSHESPESGWNFIVLSNIEPINKQIFIFLFTVISVVLAALLLLVVVAGLMAKMYTRPIYQVIDFIRQTEKNEFAVQCDLKLTGELNDLVHSYNEMVVSVRQNHILRKKAEIDALQKQVDPHFLFNTLASIKALLQQNNTEAAGCMIDRLSDIFRYNMNRDKRQTVLIEEEIEHIRNYLEIQQVRFGKRLQIVWEIDHELLHYETLRFILQPIVENSISHSMEYIKKGFMIRINTKREGEKILFSVRDNGVGIEQEKLKCLQEHIDGEKTSEESGKVTGIGLTNIQERIKLFYGREYGLTILSEEGSYTEVQVRIPKMAGKE